MLKKINLKLVIIMIVSFIGVNRVITAQDNAIKYVTQAGSRLWIEGTSTVDSFTCNTHQVNGYAEIISNTDVNDNNLRKDKVEVTIPVFTLDCGKSIMNDDMYNAMKADKFPMIKYELINAHIASGLDTSATRFSLNALGYLTIAGITHEVDFTINVEKLPGGRFRLIGKKSLSMLDYNITPPSHFFGLIRAHDQLVVNFDIIAARENSIVKTNGRH